MSWVEVETKIKVKDIKEARKKIKKIARFVKKEKKVDDYFSLEYFDYPEKSLRTRHRGKKIEVNFKQRKGYSGGVHAKEEVQFFVSDLDGFFNLINDFGFRNWMHKEKTTELYQTKNKVNIELNNVDKLGWFIEVEVLCNKKDIMEARKKVINVRRRLGYSMKDVEKRGYTKMLWDIGNKSG
ncbi:MAG: class IV adenylate cyclase [Candidatus Pacearchaeota archaeon]|nr:class IV adenylate cyclase [Candidatus Pacearchaeota archaeon]